MIAELDVKAAQCYLANGEEQQALTKLSEIVGLDLAAEEFKADAGAGRERSRGLQLLAQVLRRKPDRRTVGRQSDEPVGGGSIRTRRKPGWCGPRT